MNRGPSEFAVDDLQLDGPFRAKGWLDTTALDWVYSGPVDTDAGEYLVEYHAEERTLHRLVAEGAIGIYCVSNRCRSRYLVHRSNEPTLVAAVVGILVDRGGHYVGLVTLDRPGRTSKSRSLSRRVDRTWQELESPNVHGGTAEFSCPRCRAKGRATAQLATAQSSILQS